MSQGDKGDKVVTRKTFHGTNTGEFVGMPPTGKKASFDVIDILRATVNSPTTGTSSTRWV